MAYSVNLERPKDDDTRIIIPEPGYYLPTWILTITTDIPLTINYSIFVEYKHPAQYSDENVVFQGAITIQQGTYEEHLRPTAPVVPPKKNLTRAFSIKVDLDDGKKTFTHYGETIDVQSIAPVTDERDFLYSIRRTVRAGFRATTRTLMRTGYESFIFAKKIGGPRCPVCWDDVTETPRFSNCSECMGTTYSGGYYRVPLIVGIKLEQYTEKEQRGPLSISRNFMLVGLIPFFNGIYKDDIIVVPSLNSAFNIRSAEPDAMQRGLRIVGESLNPSDPRSNILTWI